MNLQSGWMKKSTAAIALTLTASGVFANGSLFPEAGKIIDIRRTFNMQVPLTPYTNPGNPAYEMRTVDCGKLGAKQHNGKIIPIMTESYLYQFDREPYRTIRPEHQRTADTEGIQGTSMMEHLGSLKGPNQNHQLCVAQAETISGKAKRQGGTSVPAGDDRYCPPFAALRMCMTDPAVKKVMSPVWKWNQQTNTLEFSPR